MLSPPLSDGGFGKQLLTARINAVRVAKKANERLKVRVRKPGILGSKFRDTGDCWSIPYLRLIWKDAIIQRSK